MSNKSITGVTVITHGYQPFDSGGDSLMPLAETIRSKIAQQTGGKAWLLDYDVPDDQELGRFDLSGENNPPVGADSGHVVLLFDWAPESNRTTGRFADSAGDALFSMLAGIKAYNPRKPVAGPDLHMIAHSFGSGVTSEAVERMARYKIPVANMTLLDPHDFDQAGVPVDQHQQIFTMGKPDGYGATVWNNVEFADVYYQTRGNQDSTIGLLTNNPEGRPISGAHNRHLSTELPAGNPFENTSSSDHSYVWEQFYRATVDGVAPAGALAPQVAPNYAQTGWAFSVHNTGGVSQTLGPRNFYGATQNHEHSNPALVNVITGNPNATGLAGLGITQQQVTDGRWTPDWQITEIANGNFAGGGENTFGVSQMVSGWSHHGGEGTAHLESETDGSGTNWYLQLDTGDTLRRHNFLYVPVNAKNLKFEARVTSTSSDDTLNVRIGHADHASGVTSIGTLDITATHAWQSFAFGVPQSYRGTVTQFEMRGDTPGTFNFAFNAEVDFDSFEWEMLTPQLAANPVNNFTIDFGFLQPGEVKTLANIVKLSNVGEAQSIIDVYHLLMEVVGTNYFESPDFDYMELLAGGASTMYDLKFIGAMALGAYSADFTFDTTYGSVKYHLLATVIPEPAIVGAALLMLGLLSRSRGLSARRG